MVGASIDEETFQKKTCGAKGVRVTNGLESARV